MREHLVSAGIGALFTMIVAGLGYVFVLKEHNLKISWLEKQLEKSQETSGANFKEFEESMANLKLAIFQVHPERFQIEWSKKEDVSNVDWAYASLQIIEERANERPNNETRVAAIIQGNTNTRNMKIPPRYPEESENGDIAHIAGDVKTEVRRAAVVTANNPGNPKRPNTDVGKIGSVKGYSRGYGSNTWPATTASSEEIYYLPADPNSPLEAIIVTQ